MRKYYFTLFLFAFTSFDAISQTVVKMEKKGGVYYVPCKVNGLSLSFIFDTGAGDVSISLTEANFMIKNGQLKKEDIIGTEYYRIANGDLAEGTKIIIRKLEISGLVLTNVEASVVHTLNAPLLLGQSALQKLGTFTVNYSTNTITFSGGSTSSQEQPKSNVTTNNNLQTIVRIGTQVWAKQNLNVDTFRNGDKIQEATNATEWEQFNSAGTPAWCWEKFDYKTNNRLYNWSAVNDKRGLAPFGWHIPTHDEWNKLVKFLGGESVAGHKLKSSSGWDNQNNGDNTSGFNALPVSSCTDRGTFADYSWSNPRIQFNSFWSTTTTSNGKAKFAWVFHVKSEKLIIQNGSLIYGADKKNYSEGFSVRCIKNE